MQNHITIYENQILATRKTNGNVSHPRRPKSKIFLPGMNDRNSTALAHAIEHLPGPLI
jgi:hypothetical protein